MGRLAGFKYHEVIKRLRKFGYVFDRPGPGSHEVWINIRTRKELHSQDIQRIWRKVH